MATALVIDDDAALREVLAMALENQGHTVLLASDGAEGLALIERSTPDVVISDVNMPKLDGFALCRQLRAAGNAVPLLLLTSRDSDIDEALGLELGADDYVAKPFSTRVLLARVAALLRREVARATPAPPRTGDLQLDDERLSVTFKGKPITVTVTEFRLLQVLCSRPGIVFSRTRLLEVLRGDDVIVEERIIDTYVRRLRRKLEEVDAGFNAIETMIGAGYRWRE